MAEANTFDSLDPRLQKQVKNAERAIANGNVSYAIPVCLGILKQHPEALEVRKVLRRAQRGGKAFHQSKGVSKLFKRVTQAPFMFKGNQMVKKDPDKAMIAAETALTTDPSNVSAHKLLGQAAEAKALWATAAFAYESIREIDPEDTENLKALGKAYIEQGKNKEAIVVGDALLKMLPGDADGQDIVRQASVAQTVSAGSWEGDSSFRDRLADAKEAEEMESASASMTTEESLGQLLEKEKARLEEEPENINIYKQIVNLHRRLKQPVKALEWIQKARQLEQGRTDVTLERIQHALQLEVMDSEVEAKKLEWEADKSNADKKAAYEQADEDRRAYRLKQAQEMVKRYPNELSYRYELGELLFEDGKVDESIEHFQKAVSNPKVRIQALYYLGRAFKEKGIYDLAIEQLERAREEIPSMNDQKKSVVYQLADAYDKKGDADNAIAEYKKIYAADIGYRDVSEKINKFYEAKS